MDFIDVINKREGSNMKNKRLTIKQRKHLDGLITGRRDINTKSAEKLLALPEAALTMEALLDEAGLSDDQLSGKVASIINRKQTRNISKTGFVSTNQTGVDSNTLNAIKLIWQVKGKFAKDIDRGKAAELSGMSDDQLDKIIKSGTDFIKVNKVQISRGENKSPEETE